jgi:ACT domain-containing protein
MKSSHVETVLYLYDLLLSGKSITIEETMEEWQISRATFKRYLSDIRCFLCEYRPNLSLVYEAEKKVYSFQQTSWKS